MARADLVLLTLLFLAVPSLLIVAFGQRAQAFSAEGQKLDEQQLLGCREIVLALFIVLTASSLAA